MTRVLESRLALTYGELQTASIDYVEIMARDCLEEIVRVASRRHEAPIPADIVTVIVRLETCPPIWSDEDEQGQEQQ